jgi:serine/threonine protein kinase
VLPAETDGCHDLLRSLSPDISRARYRARGCSRWATERRVASACRDTVEMTGVLSSTEREVVRRVTGADVVEESLVQDRHHIVRVVLADTRTVVLKRLRAAGEKRRDGDIGFDREWAALSHLNGCDVVPRFLGGDKSASVLIMSELPPGRSLADALLGDDRNQAVADLAAYATALASVNSFPAFSTDRPARLAGLRRGGAVFAADDVLNEVVNALDTGPQGVLHGDPCPDNVVIDADGVCRIFDFEFATGGPVALDASYLLAPFPSCWCFAPLPADAVEAALTA